MIICIVNLKFNMVDVTPTRILTFRITKADGSSISVMACDDQNSLQQFGGTADRRVLIKKTKMTADKEQHAIITTLKAFESHEKNQFLEIAREIKEEFNSKYERDWHCFVFKDGASSITHLPGCYIWLVIGDSTVVLFKK